MAHPRKRILAVASSGGHWVQLARLRPAFADHDVAYLTTVPDHREEVEAARYYTVEDANRWTKLRMARSAWKVAWVVLHERPDIVISTGAAPGYVAIRVGRLIGARTIWVDSMANVDELLSGRLASAVADVCLTQWPHLADGPWVTRGPCCDLRNRRHAAALRSGRARRGRVGRRVG